MLFATSLHAYTITGKALDDDTGKALAGITVGVDELNIVTRTGRDGSFFFDNIEPGKYHLHFSHLEYGRQALKIKLKRNFLITVKLKKKIYTLEKKTNYYYREKDHYGEQSVTNKEIRELPMRGMGDSLHLLQSLPGIGGGFALATVPIIRGSNPLHNRYYVDDIPVDYPYHYIGSVVPLISSISETVIERASVIKGTSPMYYDDNLGNVISIKTKKVEETGVHGKVLFDPLLPAMPTVFVTAAPTKSLNVMCALRRSFIDLVTDFDDKNIWLQDHYVRVSYNLYNNHRITFTALGADDYMRYNSYSSRSRFDIETLKWEYLVSRHFFLKTIVSRSFTKHALGNSEGDGGSDGISVTFNPEEYRIRQMLNAIVSNYYLRGGYDLIFYSGSVKGNVDINEMADTDLFSQTGNAIVSHYPIKGTSFSMFAEGGGTFEPVSLNLGMKYKYYGPLSNHSFSCRAVAAVDLIERIRVYGGGGIYSAHPDMYYYLGESDPDFKDSRAFNSNIGVKGSITKTISAQLEFFYSHYNNLTTENINIINAGDYRMIAQLTPFSNEETGNSYGMEIFVKGSIKNFSGWVSYTLSASKRNNESNDIDDFDSDFSQTHIFRIVLAAHFGAWTPSIVWHLYSSLPYTPVTGSSSVNGINVVEYGDKNSRRFDPHNRLDFKLSWQAHKKCRLFFEFWNVYGNTNNDIFQIYDGDRDYGDDNPKIQSDYPPVFFWAGMELCF